MKTKIIIIVMLSCCFVLMGTTDKRKVALVVTYQNESGFWRAYGPIQHVNVGGYKSEDEPIQHACGKAKDNIVFIIHIDKYNVYALRKRLESYDLDARLFLAKNGIRFDSNDLIDRIENEISAGENNKQSNSQTQNSYSQSSNNSQFQQQAERARQLQIEEQRQQRQRELQQQQRDEEAQRQRYTQQAQQQQQATEYAQRQKDAQIQAQIQNVNRARQELNNTVDKGLSDISNTITQLYANKLAREENQREQERLAKLQDEEDRRQQKIAEEEEDRQRQERNRIIAEENRREEERQAMQRQNNRLNILDQFPEGYNPNLDKLSNENVYYFFYAYDKNSLSKESSYFTASTPFCVQQHKDGTWPSRAAIRSQITALIPENTTCTLNGYFTSYEEAMQSQKEFCNLLSKSNVYINKIEVDRIIERALRNELTDLKSVNEKMTESKVKMFIYNYPNSKFAHEILTIYNNSVEDKIWTNVKTNNYLNGYFDYLKKYPKGRYQNKALEIINNSDEAAFKEATTKGTVDAYDEYLSTFEFGKYRYEATTLRKDQSEFDAAIKTGTIESITKYIEGNHLGKNSDAAKQILEKKLLDSAERYFVLKGRSQEFALPFYQKYIQFFPDGSKISLVKERVAIIDKNYKKQRNIAIFGGLGGLLLIPLIFTLIL